LRQPPLLCPYATIMADSEKRTLNDKFMLRLPDGMRDRIKVAADQNNRSMNAEIVATLERAYPLPKPPSDYDQVIAEVMADGKSRSIVRNDSTVHFSKADDGRVILDVVDTRSPRSPKS